MKTTIRTSLLVFPFSIFCFFAVAQDQIYTQYQNAPLYYNPALTGADRGIHTYSLGRLQWMNLPFPVKSFDFSGDLGIRGVPGLGGIGIIINGGKQVFLIDQLQVGISISSRMKFSTGFFAQFGIKGSVIQRKVNWDEFVFADEMNSKYGNIYPSSFIPPDANTVSVVDFGAGVLLQYVSQSSFFSNTTGIAVDHIFTPNVSFLSTGSSPYPRNGSCIQTS